MGKFRQFLITEEIGLGDLGQRIGDLMNNRRFSDQIGGAFVSSGDYGSEQSPTMGFSGHSLNLPSTDLVIPSIKKQGRINCLILNKNPIYIRLSDGTEANFTYDEYRRIDGKPELGKTMTIIFQRHPQDLTKNYSKIDKAMVSD